MHGVSEIQRRNSGTPFAKQPGAYVARAIEIAVALSPVERNILEHRGTLPPIVADQALREGFDDFQLARAVKEHLAEFSGLHAMQRAAGVKRLGYLR